MPAGTVIKHKRKSGAFTGGDLAAGEIGVDVSTPALYFSKEGTTVTKVGGATVMSAILAADYIVNSDGSANNVADLTLTLTAGRKYRITAILECYSWDIGGILIALGGTVTATTFKAVVSTGNASAGVFDIRVVGSLGSLVAFTAPEGYGVLVEGFLQVNTGGTLIVQFAQSQSDPNDSELKAGSSLTVIDVT